MPSSRGSCWMRSLLVTCTRLCSTGNGSSAAVLENVQSNCWKMTAFLESLERVGMRHEMCVMSLSQRALSVLAGTINISMFVRMCVRVDVL